MSKMRKVLFRQHQTVSQGPKKGEMIVAKRGTAGYFFVFVYCQNQGGPTRLHCCVWLVDLTENKPNRNPYISEFHGETQTLAKW